MWVNKIIHFINKIYREFEDYFVRSDFGKNIIIGRIINIESR